MACSMITDWDWKSGTYSVQDVGGINVPLNYFSCGTYYFDGVFHVVEFPAGMQIYNGSNEIANYNVEFPTSRSFYDENHHDRLPADFFDRVKASEESVEAVLGDSLPHAPGWFTDPSTAQLYSSKGIYSDVCRDKCVMVYSLKNTTKFINLDNNFNIWKLMNFVLTPPDIKTSIEQMFQIQTPASASPSSFGKISLNKNRLAIFDYDEKLAKWLCATIPKSYAGYAANVAVSKGNPVLHLQFMFCNPMRHLERNLKNRLDWQFNDAKPDIAILNDFVQQLSLYKTMNVDAIAGNLYEHTVWTILFAEKLMINDFLYKPNDFVQRYVAALALIHDIGFMVPELSIVRKRDIIIQDVPNGQEIAVAYANGSKLLPMFSEVMTPIGFFDFQQLFKTLQITDAPALFEILKHQRVMIEFLEIMSLDPSQSLDVATNEYIDKVGLNLDFDHFYALVRLSEASILASQPFGMDNLTVELNHSSRFFHFIKNVPKKYRGGNFADRTSILRNAFVDMVLKKFLSKKSIVEALKILPPIVSPILPPIAKAKILPSIVSPIPPPIFKVPVLPPIKKKAPISIQPAAPVPVAPVPVVPVPVVPVPVVPVPVVPVPVARVPIFQKSDWLRDRVDKFSKINARLKSIDVDQWELCLSGPKAKFRDQFDQIRMIGSGSFGNVYRAYLGDLVMVVKEALLTPKENRKMNRAVDFKTKWDDIPKSAYPEEYEILKLVNACLFANQTPNFLFTYNMSICGSCKVTTIEGRVSTGSCYVTFMESADHDMSKWGSNLDAQSQYSLLYQILIAVHVLHYTYGIFHRDIKLHNILVKEIVPGGFFKYVIGSDTYFVKNTGKMAFVGDFGVVIPLKPSVSNDLYGVRNAKVVYDRLYGGLVFEPIVCKFSNDRGTLRPPIPQQWSSGEMGTYNSFYKGIDLKPNVSVDLEDTLKFPPFEFFKDIQDVLRMFVGGKQTEQPGTHSGLSNIYSVLKREIMSYGYANKIPYTKNSVRYIRADEMLKRLYKIPTEDVSNVIGEFVVR